MAASASGLGGGFGAGFGHELFGGGDGLIGGNFGAGFVDVVDVEGRIHDEDGGAGFRAGALGLMDVLGGKIAKIAVGDDDGFLILHGNFQQAGEGDHGFAGGVPVPRNDATGSEFDFDDGRALAGIAAQGGERGAIGYAGNGCVLL